MGVVYSGTWAQGWAWSNDHIRPPAGPAPPDPNQWNTAAGGLAITPVARPAGSAITSAPPDMRTLDGTEVTAGHLTVMLAAQQLTTSVDGQEFRWDFDATGYCGGCLLYAASDDGGTVRVASVGVRTATEAETAHSAPAVTVEAGATVVTWCVQGIAPAPTQPDGWPRFGNDSSGDIGVAAAVMTAQPAGTVAPGDWTGNLTDVAVTYTAVLVDTPQTSPETGGAAVVEVSASAGITVAGDDDGPPRMAVRVAPIRVANRASRIRTAVRARPARIARKG